MNCLLLFLKLKLKSFLKQEAIHQSILIRNFKMKNSHCPAPIRTSWVFLFYTFLSFSRTHSLEMLTFFWGGIVFKMKSRSNIIFKPKSNGIVFDWDFISKMMPHKKVSISGKHSFIKGKIYANQHQQPITNDHSYQNKGRK